MSASGMELPGGLLHDGRLRRDYRFRAVTGGIERALAESGLQAANLAQQVSLVLAASLQSLAGRPADLERVRALCSGDRQFLVLRLATLLDPAPRWITLNCGGCAEPIQFQVLPDHLPVTSAGDGYPQRTLALSIGEVRLRVPNGADEEFIAASRADDPQRALLSRLIDADVERLSETDRQSLDLALDEMTPQAGLTADIQCPHCGLAQPAAIDPYAWVVSETGDLDREIHTLAFHYHWSERDILDLPRRRRARYLLLIDRSLGKYRADDLLRGGVGGGW